MYYRIPIAKIAHELIDGEVIIIHFDSGNYYSLKGVAAHLWDMIAKGASQEQTYAAFKILTPEQQGEIDKFFEYLISENLVVVSEAAPGDLPSGTPCAGKNLDYESPKIDKYQDMQQLLAVDPIHEVAEEGWPKVKQD